MVHILANGEIVQDDDPRVRTNTQHRNTPPQGFFDSAQNPAPPPPQHADGVRAEGRPQFMDINQQLVTLGFPRRSLGNQVVEPVMSIVLLFLIMILGVRGLLLVGFIYVVSHLSQR
ncbi:protein FAM241B [Pleurodeles waltl]|uniref:protein FAM241B n=1 Tax=Pleurodeles waltl TaxID=8319 RepID=UPI003709408B